MLHEHSWLGSGLCRLVDLAWNTEHGQDITILSDNGVLLIQETVLGTNLLESFVAITKRINLRHGRERKCSENANF